MSDVTHYTQRTAPPRRSATGHDCGPLTVGGPQGDDGRDPYPGVRWTCPDCGQQWEVAIIRDLYGSGMWSWRPVQPPTRWARFKARLRGDA